MNRTYGEDLWCVMKHDGLANVHIHETLEKLHRTNPNHPAISVLEQQYREIGDMRKNLIEKWGSRSKQEDYSCNRCDEDLRSQLSRKTYKDTSTDSSIIRKNLGENKMELNPLKKISSKSGISLESVENNYAGEGLGALTDMVLDVPFTTFGAKIAKGLMGLAETLFCMYGKGSPRTKDILLRSATHLIVESFDPTLEEAVDILRGGKMFSNGVRSGSLETIKNALLRPKSEINMGFNSLRNTVNPSQQITKTVQNVKEQISAPKVFNESRPVETIKTTIL